MFAEPTKYGFMEGAGVQFDEVMYVDHIHPTSAVHDILAREVARFLSGQKVEGTDKADGPLCVFGVVFILATAQAKFKHSGQLQEEPLAVQDLVLGGKGGSKDPAVQSGSWRGYESLKHVFVFGDSYSSVGFESGVSKPTPDMPLGVPWPGKTYCGPREPNWVGHLSVSYNKSGFLVYDYAVGGHTVTDVADQVRLRFLVNEGDKMKEAIKWAAADSLFVTWVGTNDVAYANFDAKRSVRYLFTLQQELYRAGARNFLLLNVPPLPLPMSKASETHPQLLARIRRCTDWNNMLSKLIDTFVEQHQGSSVFLFDAHACFERMFNDPPKYGFPKGSGKAYDKHMYVDHIHPSSGMHKVIAEELAAFLNGGK
ncbi:hypothetical protein FRB99_005294 [Tulasnella sp. 403]|nr:hypothetical protein FRB99_005294 [Tulasnella sp. 403]